jgi:hypothetical protein
VRFPFLLERDLMVCVSLANLRTSTHGHAMETNNSHRPWLCAEKWATNETQQNRNTRPLSAIISITKPRL